jgi:hypothetical protein
LKVESFEPNQGPTLPVVIADPVVWSTLVQTAVLSLTLLVFILSFRSQEKAIREQAYQKVLDDYGDIIRMQSETPELYRFQVDLFKTFLPARGRDEKEFSREDLVIRNYVVMIYGFFERIHSLYRRKWIDEETWRQWAAFLKVMTRHPVFKEVHQSSTDMWDKPFVDYVNDLLRQNS